MYINLDSALFFPPRNVCIVFVEFKTSSTFFFFSSYYFFLYIWGYSSPRGDFTYVHMTHGRTQVYVRASQRDASPSSPHSLAGKKKKLFFFFCIGGINSRHLDAAQNRDFGGSINFKNRPELPRPGSNALFRAENRSVSSSDEN